jgi:GNAT superfamily N-acetyltransferase
MDIHIRPVSSLQEALSLTTLLDRCAEESMAEFRDTPLAAGVSRRLLERHFTHSTTLLLVAESQDGVHGVSLTAPFEDPLTSEIVPMMVILHVDRDLRHRGIAAALVDDARRILGDRGHRTLAARAGHNDDALISMGERWGFVRHWELMLHE